MLHACPGCDLRFATITHRFVKGKETKVKGLLKQVCISPEVDAAMRNAPQPVGAANEEIADERWEEEDADDRREEDVADEPRRQS